MITPTVHTSDTDEEAAQALATALAADVLDGKQDILLLLSGGSALDILEYLPSPDDATFLTISVIDERDDPTRETSNFHTLERARWFQEMVSRGALFIDPLHSINVTKEAKAESFGRAIRQWKETHGSGHIIAVLGMGQDGHTMGVLPSADEETFTELFLGARRFVAHTVHDAPSCPDRITATFTFLQNDVNAVYCYICGEPKREPLRRALSGTVPLHELPIGIIATLPAVQVFTDLRL